MAKRAPECWRRRKTELQHKFGDTKFGDTTPNFQFRFSELGMVSPNFHGDRGYSTERNEQGAEPQRLIAQASQPFDLNGRLRIRHPQVISSICPKWIFDN